MSFLVVQDVIACSPKGGRRRQGAGRSRRKLSLWRRLVGGYGGKGAIGDMKQVLVAPDPQHLLGLILWGRGVAGRSGGDNVHLNCWMDKDGPTVYIRILIWSFPSPNVALENSMCYQPPNVP